jgi:fatty acid desaturase
MNVVQEHDLIHELYFKTAPWVQHVMFTGIWLIKSNAAPWWRKYYHLKHHMESGQTTDVEERLIGLGLVRADAYDLHGLDRKRTSSDSLCLCHLFLRDAACVAPKEDTRHSHTCCNTFGTFLCWYLTY